MDDIAQSLAQTPWLLRLNDAPVDSSTNPPTNDQPSNLHSDHSAPPATHSQAPVKPDHHDGHLALPDNTLGLALSGGGIRSATFCLGVIQSLAKQDWLKHVDYLSTVSGGGYTGAFLGRFFDVCQDQDQIHDALTDSRSQPVHWLRTHSNYLAPRGTGDTVFNLAFFWRNLFTLHLVVGMFVFAILGLGSVFEYYDGRDASRLLMALQEILLPLAPLTLSGHSFVMTPWWIFAELTLWLGIVPLTFAYWVVSQDRFEDFILPVLLATLVLAIASLLATVWLGAFVIFGVMIVWILFVWSHVKKREGHGRPDSEFHMALARNYLTRFLGWTSAIGAALVAIAVIDSLGRAIARQFLVNGSSFGSLLGVLGGSASLIGLAPLLRGIANYLLAGGEQKTGIWTQLAKIPYLPSALILAVTAFLPLVFVSFVVHTIFELGHAWWNGVAATVVALLISFLLGRRSLISFVNRSGYLTIYSARLARVFLGAVNPRRHRFADGNNVSHLIYGDDVPLNEYKPHVNGGPLHLINVAVNETIDVASQRGIRDRKAENMSVGPAGISVAKAFHAIWTDSHGKKTPDQLQPVGNTSKAHPFVNKQRLPVDVESLNLREWIAISGAAFSPGMGRATDLARSLLLTVTNLRLGYWWDSGIASGQRFRVLESTGFYTRVRDLFHKYFAPQSMLLSEALGRFGGPWRRYWYLTDGGHFELTGAYELLRRRLPFIIAVDVGADPRRQGSVLAWLMRLARIDFGAEFENCEPGKLQAIGVPDDITEKLGSMDDLMNDPDGDQKTAALIRVTWPTSPTSGDSWHGRNHSWMLYIRASVTSDAPADVRSYAKEHLDFPNESTLDQFYDEPQWESYRKLGEHIGDMLFQT